VSEISTEQSQDIRLQIVESAEGISEFGEYWDDLFARAVDAPPFLSRPWVSTFIHEGRIKGTPLFMLAWYDSKLVALFPLAVRKYLNAKIAVPIGIGEVSYLGILRDPEYSSVVGCIAEKIISERLFDVYLNIDLSSVDASVNDFLTVFIQKGYSYWRVRRTCCYLIQLGCSSDEYFSQHMSSRTRRTLNREERRLLRDADVRIQFYTGKEITHEIVDRIAAVQEESWMKRRGVAVFGEQFHRKLMLEMAHAGNGCLWLMTINNDDAAFLYAFIAHRKLYLYWTAFKLRYKTLSIGKNLLMHAVCDACSNDISLIDFGPGDAEYKRFWATDYFDVSRAIAASSLRGRLIAICYCTIWRLASVQYLHSFYRYVKYILRRFKQKAAIICGHY